MIRQQSKSLILFLFGLLFLALSVNAQSYVDVTGNKKYLGLQNFTQGTTVTTANFTITGAGDTLRMVSQGDSCYVSATNKVSIVSPTYIDNTINVKGAGTFLSVTTPTATVTAGTITTGTVTTLGSTTATITNLVPTTIKPSGADSATIYALTPSAGWTKYCTDCTANDNSVGCFVTYNGALWKRHW